MLFSLVFAYGNMKIVAHTIVRNESRWVWFAVKSVLDYVDEVMVWDTGSTDNTARIIKSIDNPKVSFRQIDLTPNETALSQIRQRMLDQTQADWLMILDGDETWPDNSIQTALNFINTQGRFYDSIVVPTLNCVGDVFHFSSPSAGHYFIAGKTGHYNLRFINLKKILGLHVSNFPGQLQSYYDSKGVKIQERDPQRIAFVNAPYLHMTHLTRSSHFHDKEVFWRSSKFKYDLGGPLPASFEYPKCFYHPRPRIVSPPWTRRSLFFILNAAWQTPIRAIKNYGH